jgi:hypothetical protein
MPPPLFELLQLDATTAEPTREKVSTKKSFRVIDFESMNHSIEMRAKKQASTKTKCKSPESLSSIG